MSTASVRAETSTSLGELIAGRMERSVNLTTLLDCLRKTSSPAIHSPDTSRPPLCHDELSLFVSQFSLPCLGGNELGPNDRVMLALETGPESALALIALASYHTCAPVNANCTASELRDDARRLGAKAVVTTKDAEERLELSRLRDELGCHIIFLQRRICGPAGLFDMKLMGDENVAPLSFPSTLHTLSDMSLVLHTSGTSGKKKVVRYSLRSLLVGTWSVIESWGLQPTDVNFNLMPLFHVGGIVRNLLAPILSGGSTVMCSECDPIAFWNLSTTLRVTWYYAAPTIHKAIISARPDGEGLSEGVHIRMVCNAAGALLPSLAVDLKNTFNGAVVLPSYGMTECMPIASPPLDYKLDRPGCSGIACGPHLSIRNPGDLEREVPYGTTGAISVRGPPTFEGYEVSPDLDVPLDKSAFSSEGWFDTGDVGFMDKDGYLFITGRSKEIINKGGEVVSPFEIEEAVMTVAKDYVQNTLAFAIDHDILQETIGVILVPLPNQPRLSLPQLQRLLKNYLHPSKWPFVIVYMDDMPKNSAGKPLRIKLASRLGIGCLSDKVPILHRHFEAERPHAMASVTEPIRCSPVTIDQQEIERVLGSTPGIVEFAFRLNQDNCPEAFVFIDKTSGLDTVDIQKTISERLPGYCIPELHHLTRPITRIQGEFDFDLLKEEITHGYASGLSEREKLVCEIFANLLRIEPAKMVCDSDFFLLGGNSLLLGQLSYTIRTQTGAIVRIPALFRNSTIEGVASLIDEALEIDTAYRSSGSHNPLASAATLQDFEPISSRNQTNPLAMIIQAIPFLFFFPLKAALIWALLLYVLSALPGFVHSSYGFRLCALILAIVTSRVGLQIISPLTAIAFKWIVIGRYKVGTYPMWSTYHLRWWIVDRSLRSAGKGIFKIHPSLEILYYRMLGTHIGKGVLIDETADLREFDLLTLKDGCRIDGSHIRGFCVERDGVFRLDTVTIGCQAVINTYTTITPGAVIADGSVYGPHASSYDKPSPHSYAAYNRTSIRQPHWFLRVFVASPIIALVYCASLLPWAAIILIMFAADIPRRPGLNSLESIIWWYSTPTRIAFHISSKIVRATITPLLHLLLAILVKRAFGLNKQCSMADASQLTLLRRYINSILLSQEVQKEAFMILGPHYEAVSMVFRAMGAKVGERVYWPGSGIDCLDPEMLEIGNDVVFGSRSEFFTTDQLGTEKIVIGDGAMVADRAVVLPGVNIGRRTLMGTGALCKRNGIYADGETWIGNEHGEAICLSKKTLERTPTDNSTLNPFGRAYLGQADYFVFPYFLIFIIGFLSTALSAAFWSIKAIAAAQLLRQIYIHAPNHYMFRPHWHRFGTLYGLIASTFFVLCSFQGILCILWTIVSKRMIIGQRKEGQHPWDQSSYCQRWKLHLTVTQFINEGGGAGGILPPLNGSVYLVWYLRAMGAKIGRNCAVFAGGKIGLITEPDLVELGDNVNIDDASVVAHINTRGIFALNRLKVGSGCAMRSGSRLLSGASMEDGSMLCEHSLLTSGEIAASGVVYAGWPAREMSSWRTEKQRESINRVSTMSSGSRS